MARKLAEIKKELTGAFVSNSVIQEIYGLSPVAVFDDEFSKVSLENILFDVFAFSVFVLEKLFDTHKKEIDDKLANQKSGTLAWYRTMALRFQYGFTLLPDSDKYNNQGSTEEQIMKSKIIKYVAVSESTKESRIAIKIAGELSGKLVKIENKQAQAFEIYINKIKYAGTKISVINYLPDLLTLHMIIYRDPLLIDNQGNAISDGSRPVELAIQEYMKQMPFNGELVLAYLTQHLQEVAGVKIAHLVSASSSWINSNGKDYDQPKAIFVKATPVSGYYSVVDYKNISYVV